MNQKPSALDIKILGEKTAKRFAAIAPTLDIKVLMSSQEFGEESFSYDSIEEALKGFARLKQSCKKHGKKDGVERRLLLVLKEETV